jgi:voltage-gated potassium channel
MFLTRTHSAVCGKALRFAAPSPSPRTARALNPGKGTGLANPPLVISLLLAFRGLARAVAAVWRDPETKALPLVAGALVLTGTIVYWRVEDWTIIQALYFSVVTLTTVGYGDLTPTSAGTQIFTIIYILTGLGVLVALLSSIAQQYIRQKTAGGRVRERLSARRHHGQAN